MAQKIGKQPGEGDKYGYFPDVFSVSINRALSRCRDKNIIIDDDLIKDLFEQATEVKARFVRRYNNDHTP